MGLNGNTKYRLPTSTGARSCPQPGAVQYELKLDGSRGQLHLHRGAAKMFSRNGNEI
jgi:ATP-dependent DNA ligase